MLVQRELLLTQPQNDPNEAAAPFVNAEKQVADVAAALDGARAILVDRFAEDADLIGKLREEVWSRLGGEWKPQHLDRICTAEVGLDGLPAVFERMLAGGSLGRTVVRID